MRVTVAGVLHGRRIDLEVEPPIPDGTAVLVRIARAQPDAGRIRHLETEIRAFRDGIEQARRRLGERK